MTSPLSPADMCEFVTYAGSALLILELYKVKLMVSGKG